MKKIRLKHFLFILPLVLLTIQCGSSSKLLSAGSPLLSSLASNPNLSKFAGLLQTPGLDKLLGSSLKKPFTMLAPTNNALDGVGADQLANLTKPDNVSGLANLLKKHILPGKLNASDLAGSALKNIGGGTFDLGGADLGSMISSDKFNIIPVDKVLQ